MHQEMECAKRTKSGVAPFSGFMLPSFPRSAWERIERRTASVKITDAERRKKWVPMQSVGTRKKEVREP